MSSTIYYNLNKIFDDYSNDETILLYSFFDKQNLEKLQINHLFIVIIR